MAKKNQEHKGKKNQNRITVPFWNHMTYWLLGLIVVLPLLLNSQIPDPVIPVRNMFLSAFLALFATYFFFVRKEKVQLLGDLPKWYFLTIGVFWLWSCLVITQAINFQEALFVVGRNFTIFFLILVVYSTAKKDAQFGDLVFKTLTVLGAFHALVGILQFYGFVMPDEPGVVPKAFSANRNLYGSSLMLLLPFAGAVLMTVKGRWRFLAGGAIVLELASIILSQTRSAWVGLFVAFIVVHICLLLFRDRLDRKLLRFWWASNIGGLILLVISALIIIQLDVGGWLVESLRNRIGSLFGAAEAGSVAASNVSERFSLWRQSLNMIADYPFLGTGPGNWKIVAPLYLSEIPAITDGRYFLIRPHNSWLQFFVEYGLPGGLLYVGSWALLVVMGIRNIVHTKQAKRLVFSVFLLAGILAFATDMIFSFPDERPEHGVYLSIMAGITLAWYGMDKKKKGGLVIPKWLLLVSLILLVGHGLLSNAQKNYQLAYKKTFSAKDQGNFQAAVTFSERGTANPWVSLAPNADPVELLSAEAYQAQRQLEPALQQALLAQKYHPNSYRVLNTLGSIYIELQRYAEAEKVYQHCLQLTPRYAPAQKNYVLNAFYLKNYAECVRYIEGMNWQGDEQLTYILNESKSEMTK